MCVYVWNGMCVFLSVYVCVGWGRGGVVDLKGICVCAYVCYVMCVWDRGCRVCICRRVCGCVCILGCVCGVYIRVCVVCILGCVY